MRRKPPRDGLYYTAFISERSPSIGPKVLKISIPQESRAHPSDRQAHEPHRGQMYGQKCVQKEGGQIAFHPRGLSANRFWSGICQSAQNPTWRLATLIKSRVLMAFAAVGERWQKRGQKWTQKWCSKLVPKSTENIPEQFHPKSTKNHCKRLIYLAFGAVPLNYFLLQFHTVPQRAPVRA
jgi:hypothetical protein